jgi:hypothetical protein
MIGWWIYISHSYWLPRTTPFTNSYNHHYRFLTHPSQFFTYSTICRATTLSGKYRLPLHHPATLSHVRRYDRTTISTTQVPRSDSRHYQMICPPQNVKIGDGADPVVTGVGGGGVKPLGFKLTHSPPLRAKVAKMFPHAFTTQKKTYKNASKLCNLRQI